LELLGSVVVLAVAISAGITDATTTEGADAALIGLSLSYAIQVYSRFIDVHDKNRFFSTLINLILCIFLVYELLKWLLEIHHRYGTWARCNRAPSSVRAAAV
jgi:predicted RND superfamily exporter protein